MKIVIYKRTSKNDMHPENQDADIARMRLALPTDVEVAAEYTEKESTRDTRPIREAIVSELRTNRIQGVMVWSLDRWGRTTSELCAFFDEAIRRKWTFISCREGIDLASASGVMMAQMFSAFAQFERDRLRERTIAGVNRYRAQTGKWGRPKGSKNKVK